MHQAIPIETYVERAKEGDKFALEMVIRGVQERIYNLAVRMIWHPSDAEDATQEILIKVVTHLSDFRQESSFGTWVYRIASNHLLSMRKQRAERRVETFEQFQQQLETGMAEETLESNDVLIEQRLLIEEIKISCSLGMLLCLDRPHRLAYILGEIFALSSVEAASILSLSPATFRQHLSRARTRLHAFVWKACGVVNDANACHCTRQVAYKVRHGLRTQEHLRFTGPLIAQRNTPLVTEIVGELESLDRTAALFRCHPDYAVPGRVAEKIKCMIHTGAFTLLSEE